jgi:hypothetical protein
VATHRQPAHTGTTKLDNATGVTDVPTTAQYTVTYIFQCTSAAKVNLPYAIAVNGNVLPAYQTKTSRVTSGKTTQNGKPVYTSGKFSIEAEAGAKVSLYLNSDAAVGYRANPVYAVTVGQRPVVVKVTEKEGQHADSDTPALAPAPKDSKAAAEDHYTAPLTGDVWMKVSHKYTSAEVDALMPTGTGPEVIAAIKSIYDGLKVAKLTVTVAANDAKPAQSLEIKFEDSTNPKGNIVSYALLTDGLTRVHPGGYAALFNAALENAITSLNVTSCWRPMLGSIAHRAGLGLDVNYVGAVRMNRQELRVSANAGKGNAKDDDNVSDAEVKAFKAYEDSIVADKKAAAGLGQANMALDGALKSSDRAKIGEAQRAARAARDARNVAAGEQDEALKSWNVERDAAEPANARLFRASLLKCTCVRQLFDPWFMDENTQDKTDPVPNMQRGATTSNERLHSHHLHITVDEPKIL